MEKTIQVTPLYYDYVLENDYKVVVQVGGRYSGKSQNEQIRLVGNLASNEDYRLLVIEDLETGMSEGFHAGLYDRIEEFEHLPAYTPKTRVAHIQNKINGNEAIFRGYATDQQRLNVKKLSGITEIVVEEGEWMDYDSFVSLMQQLRGGNEEDRKLTILMNPVNPDCFANQYLIEQTPQKVFEYFPDGRPKVFERHITTTYDIDGETRTHTIVVLVVLSTHKDNPFLTEDQRASIEQYKDTDPDKYAQLGECKFIRPQGTYFKEFSHGIHVKEPHPIPDNWRKVRALDYGLDMLACLWVAESPRGDEVIFYKELHEPDLIISDAARRIIEVNGSDRIYKTYAPGDLWGRTKESAQTIEKTFRDNGVQFSKTSNKRVQGWLAVKEGLKVYESKDIHTGAEIKKAKITIFSNCTNLIANLPKIQRDEKDPNDCATQPHDITHILDAMRYYCVVRYRPVEKKKIADNSKDYASVMTRW